MANTDATRNQKIVETSKFHPHAALAFQFLARNQKIVETLFC